MDEQDFQSYINKLGCKLLEIRKEKGLSQQELSYMTGIEKPYIRKIEKGRTNPTVKTLLKLSSAFEMSITVFFKNI